MIVAQERDIEFSAYLGRWDPMLSREGGRVWDEMEESLALDFGVIRYGQTLTREGKAFRQRIIDYHPPEEA